MLTPRSHFGFKWRPVAQGLPVSMGTEDPHSKWVQLLDCKELQLLLHTGTGESVTVHGPGSVLQGGPWQLRFSPTDRGVLVSSAQGQEQLRWVNEVLTMSMHTAPRHGSPSGGDEAQQEAEAFIHNRESGASMWVADELHCLTAHVFTNKFNGITWTAEAYWHKVPKCGYGLWWTLPHIIDFVLGPDQGNSRRNYIGKNAPGWKHVLLSMDCRSTDGGHFRDSAKSVAAQARAKAGPGKPAALETASAEQEFSITSAAFLILLCWFHGNGRVKKVRILEGQFATTLLLDLVISKFIPVAESCFTVETDQGLLFTTSAGKVDMKKAKLSEQQDAGIRSHCSLFRQLEGDSIGWGALLSHLAVASWSTKTTANFKSRARSCLAYICHTLGRLMDCSRHDCIWQECSHLMLPILRGTGKRPKRVSSSFKSMVIQATCADKSLRKPAQLLAGGNIMSKGAAGHQLQPSAALKFMHEYMMKYWLASRELGAQSTHLHITMDATRVASRDVMSLCCWSNEHQKAFWLPPQVLALALGAGVSVGGRLQQPAKTTEI